MSLDVERGTKEPILTASLKCIWSFDSILPRPKMLARSSSTSKSEPDFRSSREVFKIESATEDIACFTGRMLVSSTDNCVVNGSDMAGIVAKNPENEGFRLTKQL